MMRHKKLQGYDIIGDIHGNATKLEELLNKMGYLYYKKTWQHKSRKVIFLGDFIDRGKENIATLEIAKSMVENNTALAVMGNHEYNALAFHTPDNNGKFLRPHTQKNIHQHEDTLKEFEQFPEKREHFLSWFTSLPLFLDLGGIRIVHACWDSQWVDTAKKQLPGNNCITKHFLRQSAKSGSIADQIVETLLKGKEISIPDEYVFQHEDGVKRNTIRVQWWNDFNQPTYHEIAVNKNDKIPKIPVPLHQVKALNPGYNKKHPPVFIGHYWKTGTPSVVKENVCCLDFSIAKGGKLTAYRWNGETTLNNENFIWVE